MRPKISTGNFYHIYNRGVDKRKTYMDRSDLLRFLDSMREFNALDPVLSLQVAKRFKKSSYPITTKSKRLVNVLCYCLNPNHYHFVLEQLIDGGVSEFMKRLGIGYTRYFNIKYDRSGALFQGKYKYKHIEGEEDLKYISAYVNANDKIHGYEKCSDWITTSSYDQYSGTEEPLKGNLYIVENKEAILSLFNGTDDYIRYVEETYMEIKRNRAEIKNML